MTANILFGVVFGVVAVGLIVWVVIIVRRARNITQASDSRLNARLYAAANESVETGGVPSTDPKSGLEPTPQILEPVESTTNPADAKATGPKEARLAELADLHERGLITNDELAAARAKILSE